MFVVWRGARNVDRKKNKIDSHRSDYLVQFVFSCSPICRTFHTPVSNREIRKPLRNQPDFAKSIILFGCAHVHGVVLEVPPANQRCAIMGSVPMVAGVHTDRVTHSLSLHPFNYFYSALWHSASPTSEFCARKLQSPPDLRCG
jgi:hypothetical protein